MIFEEREPSLLLAVLIPLLAFAVIFPVWHLGERDLYWAEGEYAAAAREISGFPPVVATHGELSPDIYPLFPLLAAGLHAASGWKIEFCLRLLSLLSLLGLGVVAWESCRRTMGLQAAAVGSSMMIATILVGEKAIDGYPHMLALLLIVGAWLSWFTFGQSRGDWDMAWASSGLLCGLAFYCNGWETLFFFALPLFFMRRPLSIWSKLNRRGFYIGVGFVLLFIALWAAPRLNAGVLAGSLRSALPLDSRIGFGDYFGQVFKFPFEAALRFLPWCVLAWAPFCAAIIPLDKNPLFSRFLRVVFLSVFAALWLLPDTDGRDILLLAPALAMLVGTHYWIVVRRHGNTLLFLIKWAAAGLLIASLACLAFALLPPDVMKDFIPMRRGFAYKEGASALIRCALESCVAGLFALLAIWICRARGMVWMAMLTLFVSGMTLFWAVVNPYKASDTSRSALGRKLKGVLGAAATPSLIVYKDVAAGGLFSECEYMDCRVKRIKSPSELPQDAKEVYVIALEVPSVPERAWTNLLPPEERYKDKRLCLWKGVLKEERSKDAKRRD